MHQVPDIVLLSEPIATDTLSALVARFFEDMVTYVVDVERGMAAVGGELHADAEALLLEDGSDPDPEAHRAAFRALLQLRPAAAKQIPFLLG